MKSAATSTSALALAIALAIGCSSAALTKNYDCTKPGNATKAQCKAAAASATPAPAAPAAAKPVPVAAPASAYSAQCKDGTAWTGKIKLGACVGHKGVAMWGAATTTAAALAAPKPTFMKPVPAKPATVAMPASGGAGQVWVNTTSKVYHCPSDPYYGKTKSGQYMTESAAIAAGARADHGKACH